MVMKLLALITDYFMINVSIGSVFSCFNIIIIIIAISHFKVNLVTMERRRKNQNNVNKTVSCQSLTINLSNFLWGKNNQFW